MILGISTDDMDRKFNTQQFYKIIHLLPQSDENTAILKNLIHKGIYARTIFGSTPLHWAATYNHPEIVQLLLKEGADVDAEDNNGETPLLNAARNDHSSMVELLITNKANVLAKNKRGTTAMHWAARNNNLEIARLLLSKGADIEAEDDCGDTPLLDAARNDNFSMVELLITNKANVLAQNKQGGTSLHWAALNNNPEIAHLLLNKGADINAKDNNGKTPLHDAVIERQIEMVRLLLAKKANTEAKDNNGETPLHSASRGFGHKIFQLLLDNGADITVRRNDGKSPLKFVPLHPRCLKKYLSIVINKIAAAGRFDCLQEDFYINVLKKSLNEGDEAWEEKLANAAKNESIDTPENMINKILIYVHILAKCRQICAIIEQQYANTMTLLKAYSLTGGLLLPNIADVPPPPAPITDMQSPAPLVFMHVLRSGKAYSHDVPAERTRKRGQRTASQHHDDRQKKTLKKPRR